MSNPVTPDRANIHYRLKNRPKNKKPPKGRLSLSINYKSDNYMTQGVLGWALPCIARLGKPPDQGERGSFWFSLQPTASPTMELLKKQSRPKDGSKYLTLYGSAQLLCQL
jgi:hypothetical protein